MVLDFLFILKHYSDVDGNVNCAACFVAISQLVYMIDGFIIEVSKFSVFPTPIISSPFPYSTVLLNVYIFLVWRTVQN